MAALKYLTDIVFVISSVFLTLGKPVSHICTNKNDGNYKDPNRCDGYISCVGGLRYPMDCPYGLWYNEMTDKCDYPAKVQCSGMYKV